MRVEKRGLEKKKYDWASYHIDPELFKI